MKKIAVLGPEGTYSDIAAKKYLEGITEKYEIEYYPTIIRTAKAVKNDTIAIIPFENTLDGFVMESMDSIIQSNLRVISQVKLDIDFAFVTNARDVKDVKNCYVQFKAKGQCLEFLNSYDFTITQTQSNMESYSIVRESKDETIAAIIPMHSVIEGEFNTVIPHVADSQSNETRFFIVTKNKNLDIPSGNLCGSIVVTQKLDRPGMLFDVLKEFHNLDINLISIMSRPMKTEMGKYRFYIECSLNNEKLFNLTKLTNNFISNDFDVQILGIYKEL